MMRNHSGYFPHFIESFQSMGSWKHVSTLNTHLNSPVDTQCWGPYPVLTCTLPGPIHFTVDCSKVIAQTSPLKRQHAQLIRINIHALVFSLLREMLQEFCLKNLMQGGERQKCARPGSGFFQTHWSELQLCPSLVGLGQVPWLLSQ